jgi:mycoredoxin
VTDPAHPARPADPDAADHREPVAGGDAASSTGPADLPVTVYWRPGCGFCSSLLGGLERSGLGFDRVDIWQDEEGAAFVRSITGGSETVPTVRVADIALVNPTANDVLREVRDRVPDHLPEGVEISEGSRLGRALVRLLGG